MRWPGIVIAGVVAVAALLQPESEPVIAQTDPLINVTYFVSATDTRFFRFVAEITNPTSVTLEGIQTRWDGLDSSGAIVGSSTKKHPPLTAGATYFYVGGAGVANLSGSPQTVQVTLTNPGSPSNAPSRFLAVTDVALSKMAFSLYQGLDDYNVSAVLSVDAEPINRLDMTTTYVLRDQYGVIVGADFNSSVRNLPDQLVSGTPYRLEERVGATGPAVSADVAAYRRP